jgi:DNA-binding NarL/FixJ family response regulator
MLVHNKSKTSFIYSLQEKPPYFSCFSLAPPIVSLPVMPTVALVDDHKIFCDSLQSLLSDIEGWQVLWTAQSGGDAIKRLQTDTQVPDILLLDIHMPGKSGIEVAEWISIHRKQVQILVLTMEQDDSNILKMLQYGVRGYVLKDIGVDELIHALESVLKYGYYYTPLVNSVIHKRVHAQPQIPELREREKELLQYMCSDLSYAEIADKMHLSESTVDSHRAKLFEKFDVKNRIGLLLKANGLGMVKL